jgi:hypothetical protein
MAGQWQKGKLIGSGTFGCVYEAANRYANAFYIALCLLDHLKV